MANKYEEVKNRVEEVEKKIFSQKIKFENIKKFIGRLEACDTLITEFDEDIWNATIDKVTVDLKEDVKFYFKN